MKRRLTETFSYHTNSEHCIVTIPGGRGCKDEMVQCHVHRHVYETVPKSWLFFWIKARTSLITITSFMRDVEDADSGYTITSEGHLTLEEVADRVIESYRRNAHLPTTL